jgi:phospholipid/cholesterol/gamma-HCH transport system permease protein
MPMSNSPWGKVPGELNLGRSPQAVTMVEGGVRLSGSLGLSDAKPIYDALLSAGPREGEITVDFGDAEPINSVALAALIAGSRVRVAQGIRIRSQGGRAEMSAALEEALQHPLPSRELEPGILETVGERTLAQASETRELFRMTIAVLVRFAQLVAARIHMPRRSLGDKVVTMGADAVGIVTLLSLLLGMILAFEATRQLGQLGAKVLVPDVVGLSLVREFAPLLCAVVVIARNGAAIASELASMRAGQEVDALRTMGIEPVSFLVLPRSLGLLITSPVLTLLAIFVGILGGAMVAITVADLEITLFYQRLIAAVDLGDLTYGMTKSLVFAFTTGLAASAIGMVPSGSAADVGRATTRAVVLGIFLLVVADAGFAFTSGIS